MVTADGRAIRANMRTFRSPHELSLIHERVVKADMHDDVAVLHLPHAVAGPESELFAGALAGSRKKENKISRKKITRVHVI
jgi:hypothetical protein